MDHGITFTGKCYGATIDSGQVVQPLENAIVTHSNAEGFGDNYVAHTSKDGRYWVGSPGWDVGKLTVKADGFHDRVKVTEFDGAIEQMDNYSIDERADQEFFDKIIVGTSIFGLQKFYKDTVNYWLRDQPPRQDIADAIEKTATERLAIATGGAYTGKMVSDSTDADYIIYFKDEGIGFGSFIPTTNQDRITSALVGFFMQLPSDFVDYVVGKEMQSIVAAGDFYEQDIPAGKESQWKQSRYYQGNDRIPTKTTPDIDKNHFTLAAKLPYGFKPNVK